MAKRKQWTISVEAAVVQEGRVLLIRRLQDDNKIRWELPSGCALLTERLDEAAVRQVRQEVRIDTEVISVIGLRTEYSQQSATVTVLFRLRPVSGAIIPDDIETVAYFSPHDVATLSDEQIAPAVRCAALAALSQADGLVEDRRYPLRSEYSRAFLVKFR